VTDVGSQILRFTRGSSIAIISVDTFDTLQHFTTSSYVSSMNFAPFSRKIVSPFAVPKGGLEIQANRGYFSFLVLTFNIELPCNLDEIGCVSNKIK
jgi:hypothetical protein